MSDRGEERTLLRSDVEGTSGRMVRFSPFLILAVCACVAGPTQRALSVKQVVENAQALDGQEIVVTGWIEYCHRLSCPLFDSAEEVGKDWSYVLSIGRSSWFDAFARRHAPTRVTLRARLNNRCISDPATRIIAACADRANTLEPIRRR
jgi:hypothetical protein